MSRRDGRLEYSNIGDVEIRRTTQKAVLAITDGREIWIPMSLLATETASRIDEGAMLSDFRCETWFAQKENLT
jgi:hypothetical protein